MLSVIHTYCVVPENIHTPPHRRDWKFRGGWGVSKTQKFKAMYEAKMEFPEGWRGVIGKIPSVGGGGGGMDIFWNHTFINIRN